MQLPLALDAILAFVFAIPIVMNYRILPVEGTPYWLFGILFFVSISHIVISLYPNVIRSIEIGKLKTFLLWTSIIIALIGTMVTAIVDRRNTAPVWGVHDIILQQEAAIRYFVKGKNPYKETYFNTPVENFRYDEMGRPAVNPALYHFVMPPGYLLIPLPFYWIANRVFGYFDGRMVIVLMIIGICIVLQKSFKNQLIANINIVLFALSPATSSYFIEGRSDVFAFFWVVLAILFLDKKKIFLASILLGVGALSKQTVWFALPVYGLYLWKSLKLPFSTVVKQLTVSIFIFILGSLPFLYWDAKAFLDSVIFYLSGNVKTGYPISGYGLSMILYSVGIIKTIHDYFLFGVVQLVSGLGISYFLFTYLFKKPRISDFWLGYGLFLFGVWYVSRYFNNSHVAYISMLFVMAVLKHWDELSTSHGNQT